MNKWNDNGGQQFNTYFRKIMNKAQKELEF